MDSQRSRGPAPGQATPTIPFSMALLANGDGDRALRCDLRSLHRRVGSANVTNLARELSRETEAGSHADGRPMSRQTSITELIAGVFFLVWATIFLTWSPVDTLRLVSGIIFLPIGLALILKGIFGHRASDRERPGGGLFGWQVTRALFSLVVMSTLAGLFQVVLDQSQVFSWVLYAVGLGLVALSTRGPWDSESSGRNRSVLGFRARPRIPR